MDIEAVSRFAQQGESELVEFKRSSGERKEAAETICAMLNHRGGHVFFGIEKDGTVRGTDVSDKTVEDIANELKMIEPSVHPSIMRVQLAGNKEVIAVYVTQGPIRPYTYKGRFHVRCGNTSPQCSREAYNTMLLERLHGEERWENNPARGWSVDDLDGAEVLRVLDEAIRRGRLEDPGTRDIREILRGLGLIRKNEMLRAAPLLFGSADKLRSALPQCMLRVARFRGTDRREFLDNRQFHGHMFDLLQKADRYLRENLPVAGRIAPNVYERIDDPLYPPVALREALANAFCHRDYSIGGGSVAIAMYDDRLEITSSGSLHFGLTPDALFATHDSLPWNPIVAGVFFKRGIIEQWGRGTLRIAELMTQAGFPRPEIEDAGGCVTVRFRPGFYTPPQRVAKNITDRQRLLLAAIGAASEGIALRELKVALPRAAEWQLKEDLALLRSLDLIETRGHGRGAYWVLAGKR